MERVSVGAAGKTGELARRLCLVSKHQLTHDNQSLVDWLQAQDSQQNILSTSIWYSLFLADLVLIGFPLSDGGGRLRPGASTGCSWGPGLSAGSARSNMALSPLGQSPGPGCNHSCHLWEKGWRLLRQLVAKKMKVVRPLDCMVCHCSASDDVVGRLSSGLTLTC